MTEKIITRPFQFGDDKESDWPPMFGTGGSGVYHMKDGRLVAGYPERVGKYGEAPYIICDTIEPYYHPKAERWVESRKDLNDTDKALGTITTDKKLPPDPSDQRQRQKDLDADMHRALHKAKAQLEAGTAPLTEEVRAKCRANDERLSSVLGIDCTDIFGKKKKHGRRRRNNSSKH